MHCACPAPADKQGLVFGWPPSPPPKYPSAFAGETTDNIGFKMCTQRDFEAPWYQSAILGVGEVNQNHRKQWELAYLFHVVTTMKLCEPGKRGLVFAVGREHLPQLFASLGCEIVATDLPTSDDPAFVSEWANTGQHAAEVDSLYYKNFPKKRPLKKSDFLSRVTYRPENMRGFSTWLKGQKFDFVWYVTLHCSASAHFTTLKFMCWNACIGPNLNVPFRCELIVRCALPGPSAPSSTSGPSN